MTRTTELTFDREDLLQLIDSLEGTELHPANDVDNDRIDSLLTNLYTHLKKLEDLIEVLAEV